MKFTLLPTLFVATLTTLVAAQGSVPVDDLFVREEAEEFDFFARDDSDIHHVLRQMEDQIQYLKRSLERRDHGSCYNSCALKFGTGDKKFACWGGCDKQFKKKY